MNKNRKDSFCGKMQKLKQRKGFVRKEKMREDGMENLIIILIIAIAAVLALRSALGHFRGQGGCCGGGGYKPRRKKLKKVLYTKNFKVEGMHCENCKNRVEEIVGDICGTAGKVDLKKGILTVSYADEVSDELIRERIERAGYIVKNL